MSSGSREHLPGHSVTCSATCFSVLPRPKPRIAKPASQLCCDGREHVYVWECSRFPHHNPPSLLFIAISSHKAENQAQRSQGTCLILTTGKGQNRDQNPCGAGQWAEGPRPALYQPCVLELRPAVSRARHLEHVASRWKVLGPVPQLSADQRQAPRHL